MSLMALSSKESNKNMEFKEFEYTTQGVRTAIKDDDVWFVGNDVAKILGYKRPTKAITDHVDEDDRWRLTKETQSQIGIELGQRGGWLINEYGVHDLILSSELPDAKKFRRWVTHEVLPSIRKYGRYIDSSGIFKETCPIKFDRAYCYRLMRDIIRANNMNKHNADNAWRDMYIGFSKQLGYNINTKAVAEHKTKIEWIADHGLMEEFCKFIQSQERGDKENCGAK